MPTEFQDGARCLVILASGRRGGLCRRLFEHIQGSLEERGVAFRAQDLLGDDFDPVLRLADGEPHARACSADEDPLTARYQADVRWANLFVIVHPVWWFAPPALLKGWIDRVLVDDVALEQREEGPPRPLLGGRSLLVVQSFNTSRQFDSEVFRGHNRFFWKQVVGASVGIERVHRLPLYRVQELSEEDLARFEGRLDRGLGAALRFASASDA